MLSTIIMPVARELAMVDRMIESESAFGLARADTVAMHVAEKRGKRMRPAVFLLAARAISDQDFKARSEEMAEIAAAIELMHTASLLHDDVLDESTERRGHPSANAVYGNRASILAGDLFWCRASELILKTGDRRLIAEFVDAAKSTTLGEMMSQDAHLDVDSYLSMIEGKTGSLFRAAARSAAIVTGAGEGIEAALSGFGRALGMAFQIADDVIDSRDARNGPAAIAVSLLGGRERAIAFAREQSEKAKKFIVGLGILGETGPLNALVDYAVARAG